MSERRVQGSDETWRPTRFKELGYWKQDEGLWRIVATENGAVVGGLYRTKAELLADLNRYAQQYGCEGAS